MRGNPLAIILSLALFAGSTLTVQAASTGPSGGGIGNMSANDGGGGGRGGRGDRSGSQTSNASNEGDGRQPCIGTSVYDCPPPPPRKKIVINTPVSDDDCTCRPYPLKVNNRTQIVLDCYETKMINGVERTLYCKRPSRVLTR